MTEKRFNYNECGKCGYFDGSCCTIDDMNRDSDEIVSDCTEFELSIYYGG